VSEKCVSEITLRLTESLKRDLQDIAVHEDRTVSDVIRSLLEDRLYGLKARHDAMCGQANAGETTRGVAR
jgi:predicted CopG family antitoxin